VIVSTLKGSINSRRLDYRKLERPFQKLSMLPVIVRRETATSESHRNCTTRKIVGTMTSATKLHVEVADGLFRQVVLSVIAPNSIDWITDVQISRDCLQLALILRSRAVGVRDNRELGSPF